MDRQRQVVTWWIGNVKELQNTVRRVSFLQRVTNVVKSLLRV